MKSWAILCIVGCVVVSGCSGDRDFRADSSILVKKIEALQDSVEAIKNSINVVSGGGGSSLKEPSVADYFGEVGSPGCVNVAAALSPEFEKLNGKILELNGDVADLASKNVELSGCVADLAAKVIELNFRISDLSDKINGFSGRFGPLDAKLSLLCDEIPVLEGLLGELSLLVSRVPFVEAALFCLCGVSSGKAVDQTNDFLKCFCLVDGSFVSGAALGTGPWILFPLFAENRVIVSNGNGVRTNFKNGCFELAHGSSIVVSVGDKNSLAFSVSMPPGGQWQILKQ